MMNKRICSCCGQEFTVEQFPKLKADPPVWKDHRYNEKYSSKCKQCYIKNKNINKQKHIDAFCKELNIPFLECEWEKVKQYSGALLNHNLFWKYFALMKLCGFYSFTYKDSKQLNSIRNMKNEQI